MKMQRLRTLVLAALVAGGVAFAAQEQGAGALSAASQQGAPTDAEVIAQQLPSYPLDTCPVSGEKLGSMGDPIDMVVEGRLVRLCCAGCKKGVQADPAGAIAKIDAAVIRVQKPMWPKRLSTCPVSGEAFGGEMGEPIDHVHGTRYVKLCCKGCKRAFEKSPEKYMAMIDQAMIEEQKASYPLSTCLISGEELGDSPKDVLYGVTLLRFCCGRCEKAFYKNPQATLAKLEAARKADKGAKQGAGAVGGAGGN